MKYIDEVFREFEGRNKGLLIKLRYDKELLAELIEETSFLSPEDTDTSERVWYYQNHLHEVQLCPYCKERKRKFKKLDKGLFPTCGHEECQKAGMSKGAKAERDWDKIQAKMRSTYKERTGYDHNMRNPECIQKYRDNGGFGVETQKARENRKKTIQERYGGDERKMFVLGTISKYGSLSNAAKACGEKRGRTLAKHRLEEVLSKITEMGYSLVDIEQSKEKPNFVQSDTYTLKCSRCGREFTMTRYGILYHYRHGTWKVCPKCDFKEMTFRSGFEKSIGEFINEHYNGEIQYNRYVNGVECDIVIPEKKIAIEANGLYWHSEIYKERNAHYIKKETVERGNGYTLIQVWEDSWNDPVKRVIIESRLLSKLGLCEHTVFARSCEIREVSSREAREFLEENHIQGHIRSSWNIGLYYGGELVELATFGKCRNLISGPMDLDTVELYRLCSKKGYSVVGGVSKLVKHSKDLVGWKTLISYADCDWTPLGGSGYEASGFKLVKHTGVDYCWVVDGIRRNRMAFTKKSLVEQGFDKDKTEVEIMHERGYKRIFGTGNLLFKLSE